jgi:hypothetical protein
LYLLPDLLFLPSLTLVLPLLLLWLSDEDEEKDE